MRSTRTVAAVFLGAGFGAVSFIMLAVEPRMGFVAVADYFDPAKVAVGYTTTTWLVENLIYLTIPIALLVVARSSGDERVARSGEIAAVLFLLVGALDRVGIQLPSMASGDGAVLAAVTGMLPVRAAVLKTSVMALGVFAWCTTRTERRMGMWARGWRALGWVVLAGSAVFVLVFIPMPLLFFVWGVGLTVSVIVEHPDGVGARAVGG